MPLGRWPTAIVLGGRVTSEYPAGFAGISNIKAKVSLEALHGEKTLADIASQYDLHPSQILNWKKALLDNAAASFDRTPAKAAESEHDVGQLFEQISKLKVANDFLARKLGQ